MIPCCAAEQLPQPTSAEALQLQRGWGLKIKLTHIEELWMGRLGLNFWKEYKWLQVCQLLLHPSVTEYSTAQGNGAWLGTVCAARWGTVLLFVSNGYFHGKTVFSCNFTSALCRVSSYLFFIPKEKAEFQGFFFLHIPWKVLAITMEKKKRQLSNQMLHLNLWGHFWLFRPPLQLLSMENWAKNWANKVQK